MSTLRRPVYSLHTSGFPALAVTTLNGPAFGGTTNLGISETILSAYLQAVIGDGRLMAECRSKAARSIVTLTDDLPGHLQGAG